MNTITDYLDSKNIIYKTVGDEVILKCPYCSREKLYINTTTQLFHCFYCEAKNPQSPFVKGHFKQLQEHWGDIVDITPLSVPGIEKSDEPNFTDLVNRYHYELKKQGKARKYLYKRGITDESINKYKLGFVRQHGQNWISIPSFEDGVPKLIKYRKCPPIENEKLDKYIREKGGKSILFNGDIIDKYDEVIIQEGELDTIILLQNGYENAVGLTVGAGTLKPSWFDKLVLKKKIILILDNDGAGQTAARDVWATRLGVDKCYNVVLPKGYDTSDFLLEYDKEELDKLIEKASRFKVDGIYSLSESLYQLYERSQTGELNRYGLPWKSVNELLDGGIEKKWLVVIGGVPASGKTSMAMAILYHFAKNYEIPGLMFCMEMSESALATKVIQLHYDLSYKEVNPADGLAYAMKMEDIPLYFGYKSSVTPQIFYNTVKATRDRYGIGIAVFDNLQRMVRSDKESDFAKASGIFKDIAMDLNIPMILISQPRKVNAERDITYDDLKGTGAISADADVVILLNRKRKKGANSVMSFDSKTTVIVDKSRLAAGGRIQLNFVGEKSKFEEIQK